MSPIFIKHEGTPVCLQVPNNDHVGLFLKLQNEEETRKYFVRYLPIGRKQELEWIEKANTTQNDLVFAISTYPQMQAIGSIGLHQIHWKDRNANLGIGMVESQCNKGLGTCAAMLMLSYAFNELGLNKVHWYALGHNVRSVAVAKKCGGEVVGIHKNEIWRDGRFKDEIAIDIHYRTWKPIWVKFKKQTQKTAVNKK